MNAPEPELTPHTCRNCGKTYHALKNSRIWCPKCHRWIKPDDQQPPAGVNQVPGPKSGLPGSESQGARHG